MTTGLEERSIDVLVVDDDGDTRELISTFLSDNLCAVRVASSAIEAADAIGHRIPDVLVSDLDLGEGAMGWVLAEKLRTDASASHVARIAITGTVDPRFEVVRAFDAYLRKPIDMRALLDLVRRLAEIGRDQRLRAPTLERAQSRARRGASPRRA